MSADAGEFTVGDPIPLTLTVTHPAGYQVILPRLDPDWGDFTVRSQSAGTTESNSDGTETTSQVIDVRLFAPGTFTTSPFPITVSDGNGQLSEINVDPISLSISSVLVEGDSELRDIKPQAALPYVNLLPWVVGIGLIAFGTAGAFLWYRRSQKVHRFPQGLGLGLTIARDIVEAHGGRLELTSVLGEGCQFTVHLPLNSPQNT